MKSSSVVCAAALCLACAASVLACSSDPAAAANDGAPPISLGDAGFLDAPDPDASKVAVDGGLAQL